MLPLPIRQGQDLRRRAARDRIQNRHIAVIARCIETKYGHLLDDFRHLLEAQARMARTQA